MGDRERILLINTIINIRFRYGLLVLIALSWSAPTAAALLPYAGLTVGQAKSSDNHPFDATNGAYLFMGIQTEYYVTYEIGIVYLKTNQPIPAKNQHDHLELFSLSALGHLPISDSSLFARLGVGGYQYFDDNDVLQDVILPTYGAGIDLGIIPRLTIRLEWQRYLDMEMNHANFDIETIRIGAFYYF